MRDFFISSFDKLVTIIVVLICLGVLVAGLGAMVQQGVLAGILVLVLGAVYAVLTGGILYLMLGVYDNTRRTAEAVEALAARGGGS